MRLNQLSRGMLPTGVIRALGLALSVAVFSTAALSAQAFEVLDETWTVTVNGQSVQVNPDGSFTIPNVSAADQFGPGGPGAPGWLWPMATSSAPRSATGSWPACSAACPSCWWSASALRQ